MDSNWNRRSLLQVHLAYNRQDVISNKYSNHIRVTVLKMTILKKTDKGESMTLMLVYD